jgi:arginyl-tRNA synthetase
VLLEILGQALADAVRKNGWPLPANTERVPLETPRDPRHGDLATNLALTLSKQVGEPPRAVAEKLIAALPLGPDTLAGVEIAGPGFINLRLAPAALHRVLLEVVDRGEAYGDTDMGGGLPVQIEYVSANPTGPMNVVSARAAAVGDSLVRILRAAGFKTSSEFYVNDAGSQVDRLGKSVQARYRELAGLAVEFPEDGYYGDYVRELAERFPLERAEEALADPEAAEFRAWALERMLESQQEDLESYGVRFDVWFRESELHRCGALQSTLDDLEKHGTIFEEEGARWFRSTQFGDEKDRVVVRANGEPTYFLADIAYHRDKHERGFRKVIDLWGPDHHSHITRMQAAMQALGLPEGFLEIEIVQQVRLLSGGELMKMSKRTGEFTTMRELLGDVGPDNARYFFLMRSTNAHLDFDLDLAKAQNDENPAYYVQYAHARICSVMRYAGEHGVGLPEDPESAVTGLIEKEELALLKELLLFPQMIQGAARAREPHRIPTYLAKLAESFHRFYHVHRVVTEDRERSQGRLVLCQGVRRVLANGLALLGVSAPERM